MDEKIIVVQGEPVYELRAFYRKEGRARYISHLDLYRTVQRAFQRARLPVWFTLGFNPHIYLTYALPLALGYQGVRESFDFRLREKVPPAEVASRMGAVMPEGIVIREVRPPVRKAEEIEGACYTLEFSLPGYSPRELAAAFEEFLSQPVIEAVKQGKKGPKTIDLKPAILELSSRETEKGLALALTLPAGVHENINPTLLVDAFGKARGAEPDYRQICRDRILCGDGEEFC